MIKIKKIKFKVWLSYYGGFSQLILRSRDKISSQFISVNSKHNRVALSKVFKLFKDDSLLEITIREVKP